MSFLLNKIQYSVVRHYRQYLIRGQTYHTKFDVFGHKAEKPKPAFQVPEDVMKQRYENCNLFRLVTAYRNHGHRRATVDPLQLIEPEELYELDARYYGLTDLTKEFDVRGILYNGQEHAKLEDIVQALNQIYCGPLTAEFSHLLSSEEREWFAEKFESIQQETINNEDRVNMAKLMLRSQAFDNFLGNKFSSVKRYGGEGGESAMTFYQELFKIAANEGVKDVLVCIAHRGRLNLLACLLELPPALFFRKMQGKREFPDGVVGSGDVLSHLTSSVDLKYDDKQVHVTMIPNPSQLEACNPVTVGKTRGRQQSHGAWQYTEQDMEETPPVGAMCLQIHGDAAFTGQGVVAELFAMADVPHYEIGGSVHFIVNNQIGYTTEQHRGRSSLYASCLAKSNGSPVIRVNAEHPEEVIRACRLAMAYKLKFAKDVIVDFVCYRKSGHNEMDEPAFTQPLMYNVIRSKTAIPDMYSQKLVEDGIVSREELNENVAEWKQHLTEQHAIMDTYVPKANHLEKQWSDLVQAPAIVSTWDTGVDVDVLRFVGAKSVTAAEDMEIHPTILKTHMKRRLDTLLQGTDINWATAEALAFGSLLYQDFNVRLSGQDVGRGTFSQRHAMLVDQASDAIVIPLNHMTDTQKGKLEIANSILSEEAVLGFEYGISIENPNILAIWEAQFGDFFTGAQIIIDTLVTGGDTKWLQQSGLVMLLPHGMDGAGPEHSSARPERFLQLTDSKEDGVDGDNVNIQVVNPTTPAQYYHLLRRQMVRNFRKPLIVMSPKMLLRHPSCVSTLSEMAPGSTFSPILPDPASLKAPGSVTKLAFVSGKHYYMLEKHRAEKGITDTALIRVEELCPFPADQLRKEITKYPNAKDFLWSQEEHRNAGCWSFIAPRFENVVGKRLRYVGRDVHATPAAGVGEVHRQEAEKILQQTFS